jgi:tetratricopeptide (TPR) repeat protein
MRSSISAALIVRNEERFLSGCLASLAGIVDEVVVVDTGSEDRSVAIAESFGAKVLHFAWRSDFAAARNFGLDAATGDWILYIDADERLSVPDGCRLDDGLSGREVFAARVGFFPRLKSTPYRELRLFRNDPRIRFEGTIHETIVPALDALKANGGARSIHSAAEIRHLGYEGDLSHKHRRNLPMLRAAVIAEPQRLYYWRDLAETLSAIGEDQAALDTCRRGLEIARRTGVGGGPNEIAALIALTYARLLRAAGGDSTAAIDYGLDVYPQHRALLFMRARVLADRGGYQEALAIVDRLRFEDGPSLTDPLTSYDIRIFGAYAHDLAGIVLLRMGRREDAAAAFALAAEAEPDDLAYRIKAAALAGQPRAGAAGAKQAS